MDTPKPSAPSIDIISPAVVMTATVVEPCAMRRKAARPQPSTRMLTPLVSAQLRMMSPTPASLIVAPYAPPAAVIRMITPAIASGSAMTPSVSRQPSRFCRRYTATAIAAPRKRATFLLPRNISAPAHSAGTRPPRLAATEAAAIKTIGSSTGAIDTPKPGSSLASRAAAASAAPPVAPCTVRTGIAIRRLHQRATHSPPSAGRIPARQPTTSTAPRSSFRISAIASGPGVGGTVACVTTLPAQIASRCST